MRDHDRNVEEMMRSMRAIMWAVVAAGTLACAAETTAPATKDATLGVANGVGGGTDSTPTPSTPTGPVMSVVISPKQVTMHVGHYANLTATPRDAQGLYVSGKKATWRSSNAAVLVVSDSGIVYAKTVGSAMVYGTIDGIIDSANVVVTAAPADTSTTPPPPPPPATPAVSSFNLTLTVAGTLAGPDTSQTELVVGATVKVTRVMSIQGDTLNPSVVAGTVTTDANGVASLQNLPGGYYSFVATAPAGAPYLTSQFAIGAPTVNDVRVRMVMRRAP